MTVNVDARAMTIMVTGWSRKLVSDWHCSELPDFKMDLEGKTIIVLT